MTEQQEKEAATPHTHVKVHCGFLMSHKGRMWFLFLRVACLMDKQCSLQAIRKLEGGGGGGLKKKNYTVYLLKIRHL